ncbi:MAG: hypothetical protein KF699_09250 [Phycisphaeraceae bacterium]|nr:hypothetical protein [Phycisphaeraceae bacterium]MBX3406366.1 hypothetical protein [Phycisphaeraceae bacterium]
MGLNLALDELRATGWSDLDSAGCAYDTDGRAYPTVARVRQEFAAAGFELEIRRIDQYSCYRASWRDNAGADSGAVVGYNEAEAAVYALAQLRRTLAAV